MNARNTMNLFANKTEIPTTDEYLKVSLNEVLDRLNKNPTGLQSEEAFVHAVITVRNAMINEKLTKWLIGLTAIVAIATALLVIVPFFTPSFEAQKLETELSATKTAYNDLKIEIETLKNQLLESQQTMLILRNQIEKNYRENDKKNPEE